MAVTINISPTAIDRPKKASCISVRILIAIMGALCPVVCYMARQNLNLAIIAMVESNVSSLSSKLLASGDNEATHLDWDESGEYPLPVVRRINETDFNLEQSTDNNDLRTYGPKYEWDSNTKSLILEAFFYTYAIFQIPAARFAERVGAKWILALATIGSSLLSLISPWAAALHPYAFVLLRAIMGVCQAALYPACYVLYTRWLPPVERSRALPALGSGAYIGSIVALTTTGYFAGTESFGWEYAYYMPFVVCAVWSIVWIYVGASSPREHRFISLEELEFIESKMTTANDATTTTDSTTTTTIRPNSTSTTTVIRERQDPSWYKILTSQHILALSVAFFASNWAFSIVMQLLPSYLRYVLLVDLRSNGKINAVIYSLYCISSPLVGAVSTLMIETRACGLTRLQIRKLFQSIAVFSQAAGFLLLPYLGCNTHLVLGLLFTQIVTFSFINGGEVQLPAELSLDFAGTIYAIGNTVGSSTSFLVPRVHNWVFGSEPWETKELWHVYFRLASAVTSVGGIIFVIFGRNDMQDFSKDISAKETKKRAAILNRGKTIDNNVFNLNMNGPYHSVENRRENQSRPKDNKQITI